MKRCPECRRDYYDDSLMYCLDDGSSLLDGPVSAEGATKIFQGDTDQTQILNTDQITGDPNRETVDRKPDMPGYGGTGVSPVVRERIRKQAEAERQAKLREASLPQRNRKKRLLWIISGAMILVAALSWFGYRYSSGNAQPIGSIAVLPFENRSSNPDTEYLSDGLTDSLIFRFSQLPNLKVSPTSSVMTFKGKAADVADVAKQLDVDAVLSGRLAQIGDNLNISVQLIDARTKKLIWAEQYDRKMADLLATQREIATTITQKLQLKLSGDEKGITKKYTSNNEAYQLYMKGRYYWAKRSRDDMSKAVDSYKKAIDLDPNFALAYAALAEVYNSMGKTPDALPVETIPKAKAAAMRALELDPSLAEAHSALGDALSLYDWDWKRSESEFKHAIEIDPNIGYIHVAYAGTYLTAANRMDEAVRESERSVELEPLALINNSVLTSMYVLGRQFENARVQAKKTYDLDPNFPLSKVWLGISQALDGRYDDAIALYKDTPPDSPQQVMALVVTGFADAKAGRKTEAESALKKLDAIASTQYVRPYYRAWIYTALGEKDKALGELQRSFEQHDCFLPRLRVDPLLDPIRDEPGFKDLIKRMNLPE